MRITLLAGGDGGSQLGLGFYRIESCELTVIANTGDDAIMHGLQVSPDPDILLYTLAGVVDPVRGWAFRFAHFVLCLRRLGLQIDIDKAHSGPNDAAAIVPQAFAGTSALGRANPAMRMTRASTTCRAWSAPLTWTRPSSMSPLIMKPNTATSA